MTTLRFVIAGCVAGAALAFMEVAWLAAKLPEALRSHGGARMVASALLPRAVWVGAGAGLAVRAVIALALGLSEHAAGWRQRRERWLAFSRAVCDHYRVAAAALLVLLATALYLVDRSVLVRLYEPLHVLLRIGMFVHLMFAWLMFGRSTVRRPARARGRGPSVAAAAVVLALFLAVRADASDSSRAALLTIVSLHGGVGRTFLRLTDVDAGDEQGAGGVPNEQQTPRAVPDAVTPTSIAKGANILLVTVDALRADHLGSYGYARPTSPHLDRFAAESVVFERAYSSAPHTSFALTSLLTGQPAMSLADVGILDRTPTLADYARAHGYQTAAFFTPAVFFVDRTRFRSLEQRSFGFESVFQDRFSEQTAAAMQTDEVLGFVERHTQARFFAWVHYFAPHEPYVDHTEMGEPFGKTSLDRYDGEIRWTDHNLGRLLSEVRRRRPNTIIAITADHGEEFGEHGGAYHGTTLYDEQIRVPLIVSVPGLPAGRISAPVSTTSVVPTLLELAAIPAAQSFESMSLARWLTNDPAVSEDDLPLVFAENSGQRMAVAGRDKLLCTVKPQRCALFDLAGDPVELLDASAQKPSRRAWLMDQLETWVARQRTRHREDQLAIVSDPRAPSTERRAAARLLARSPDRGHRAGLETLWQSESDPVVRAWLAVALWELGSFGARLSLAEAAEQELDDPELRARVALARARVRGQTAVPELTEALSQATDVNLRCLLMHTLAEWPSPAVGAALVREYDAVRSRVCCAEALARVHEPSTVPFLLSRLLDEPYVTVQAALVRALAAIRDPTSVPKLRELRLATTEASLSQAVDSALLEMDGESSGT